MTKIQILNNFFGENSTYKSYYENCKLYEVSKIIMGQSPKLIFDNNQNNNIEFHQGKILFTDYEIGKSNKYTSLNSKITNGNSILLCVRAPVGIINYCFRKISIGRGLCSIEPNKSLNINFLYYYLMYCQNYFVNNATGSTFSAISISTIKNTPFKICNKNMQILITKKIKNMFNFLDKIKEQIK